MDPGEVTRCAGVLTFTERLRAGGRQGGQQRVSLRQRPLHRRLSPPGRELYPRLTSRAHEDRQFVTALHRPMEESPATRALYSIMETMADG